MVNQIKKNLTNIVVIIGLISSIGIGFSKFAKMELTMNQLSSATAPDISGIKDNEKEIAILQKEVEVLKLEISEIKEANRNPLQ
jgi:hypothetical protein|tara:strand:+ start:1582 stop:1833 length:252 start_codon:yes stop_codon:yes gene_type:complete